MGLLAIIILVPCFASPSGRRARRFQSNHAFWRLRSGHSKRTRLTPEPGQEVHGLGLGLGRGRAADLVVAALDFADAVDLLLQRIGRAPAFAVVVPVDR